ncbi:MAG: hypothetical protein JW896_18685 [Deltaproteobacteria bacterium]|nr:hypothetical protein [Deltaproteobacteria bacterium]
MRKKKGIFGICSCIVMMALLIGCAATSSNMADSTNLSAEWAGDVYYPRLPSDIETFDAVKKDLTYLLASAKPGIKYYRQQGINHYAEEEALKALLKGKKGPISFYYNSDKELLHMVFGSIDVLDDRIEVSRSIAFFYSDLIDQDIAARKTDESFAFARVIVGKYRSFECPYKIHFPGLMSFMFENPGDAQRFADDLLFIKQVQLVQKEKYDKRLALFEAKAAHYREQKIKPPVSEEQRRFIVQANALSKQKKYYRAIDMYTKVIEIDPVSYPAAYFNMALLYAQIHRFNMAISSMKQYLVLEPEAKDARSAQDKIYEWELMVQENQQ